MQDELWINWDVQRSKNQNKCWLKERAKRFQVAKPKLTIKKTLFVIAFTSCPARFSIIALPKDEKIDAECFVQFLKDTGKRFNNLRRSKTKLRDLTLQFDNAMPHSPKNTKLYECCGTNKYWTKSLQPRFKHVWQVFIHQTAGTLQNATLWRHWRIESGRAAFFEAASKILVFKRVREAKKSLRRCDSTVRNLYYTIVYFILFI